ncbi:hypothetical protein ACJX0J_028693, partial [Zea mays]
MILFSILEIKKVQYMITGLKTSSLDIISLKIIEFLKLICFIDMVEMRLSLQSDHQLGYDMSGMTLTDISDKRDKRDIFLLITTSDKVRLELHAGTGGIFPFPVRNVYERLVHLLFEVCVLLLRH